MDNILHKNDSLFNIIFVLVNAHNSNFFFVLSNRRRPFDQPMIEDGIHECADG